MKKIGISFALLLLAFIAYDAMLAPAGQRIIFKIKPQPAVVEEIPVEPKPEPPKPVAPVETPAIVVKEEPVSRYPSFKQVKPLLSKYCFDCHGPGKDKGDFTFGDLADGDSLEHFHLLDKALISTRDESMPSKKAKEPLSVAERAEMVRLIEGYMTGVIASRPADPGRGMIRRLTKYEYRATVRDLFYGFPFNPSKTFPDEDKMLGYDVIGQTQTIDQVLGEKYIAAADGILNVVFPPKGAKLSVALSDTDLKRIQSAIITARPSDTLEPRAAASQVLRRFASRAFRRPIESERVERFLKLYDMASDQKLDYETSIKVALKAVLISPEFLLRVEDEPAVAKGSLAQPINDYELASRLSYFLWSSMPDDELFGLATKKELRKPEVLEAQIKRMLIDPKARALAESFGNQWLDLAVLDKSTPSPKVFPEWDTELESSIRLEPLFFFASMIRENRNVMEMIDCDYAFVNARLAKHYELPPVTGDTLQKVSLSDKKRGGILSMAAVLIATSYDTRTSVSHRGQWFLDRIMGTPPPPPPMNVPPLAEGKKGEQPKTLRERLALHARDSACAGCHQKVDPAGFAMENYDAIGRWRTMDSGKPLDTTGEFSDGSKVNGPEDLKAMLISKKRMFLENLTKQTLTYALGRTVTFDDRPAILDITDKLEKDPRFSTLILGVVQSVPFNCRRNLAFDPRNTASR